MIRDCQVRSDSMKPASFELHAPTSIDEAVGLLTEHGDEAKVLAGGQSLVPMLALRLARFEHLVDVNAIADLSTVTRDDGWLRVGSTVRHRVVERDTEVATAVPLLARATRHVGHFQIRNRGTLGGALAHADPAAEQPAVALALDAVLEITGPGGKRDVAASDFFQGTWTTALAEDELLTAARFPVWEGRTGCAVEEVARRQGDFALVGVVCAVGVGDEGGVDRAAIALFGVGGTPVRATEAEEALRSGATPADAAAASIVGLEPPDDLHATADYRRKVAAVLVRRAIERATEETTGA
jgi:carbon-monoxide dehydrogenase medium subunit